MIFPNILYNPAFNTAQVIICEMTGLTVRPFYPPPFEYLPPLPKKKKELLQRGVALLTDRQACQDSRPISMAKHAFT